jgi:hypothetical protein
MLVFSGVAAPPFFGGGDTSRFREASRLFLWVRVVAGCLWPPDVFGGGGGGLVGGE